MNDRNKNELAILKLPNPKVLLMAVAMTAFTLSHAFAATPKESVMVTGDRITLGDVFDGVTESADYYLAPAPAPGKTKVLNAQDLKRISDTFNLGWLPDGRTHQTLIRNASAALDAYDIQSALQAKLSEEMPGQKLEIQLDNPNLTLVTPMDVSRAVKIEGLKLDPAKGEFKALVSAEAAPESRAEVRGRFQQVVTLPVLKSPLRLGDVISEDDIEYVDTRAADVTPAMIVNANNLIGRTPRRGLPAMKPITASDVRSPTIIKKGDLVLMSLKSSTLSLTTQGRAMQDGSTGDAIQVMNLTSKQVVSATIDGPQAVTVPAPFNAL